MKKWVFAIIGLTLILAACSGEYVATGEPLPYDPNERAPLELPGGNDKEDDAGDEEELVDIPDNLTDGVYETTGEGFGGDIVVQTTIEGGKITKIEILSHSETDGISDPAINGLPGTIIDAYSLGVDNVTGASWSSKGIKEAVRKAIMEASGEGASEKIVDIPESLVDGVYETTGEGLAGDITVQTTVEGGKVTKIEVLSHSETEGISDPAINDLPGAIIDAYSLGVDNVSGATWTSKGIKEAVEKAIIEAKADGEASGGESAQIPEGLTDGVYETAGEGFGGDITVQTTVEGGKITKIEVLSHDETDGISDPAIAELPGMIIEANSLDVDNVSGASWTSKGIKAAVEAAVKEASGN